MSGLRLLCSGIFLLAAVVVLRPVLAGESYEVRREVRFADLPGYKTLVCDFHMHTVFSDGKVWPTVRVDEAWRQGFAAIALSDHIEYQPHKQDVSRDRNRSYEWAVETARTHDLLLIKAAEITRKSPPGHFNALFLDNVNELDVPDFLEAVKRANAQGGFVFWNHHALGGEQRGRWDDVHETMFNSGWLHGMEVCNGDDYYPTAHRWCLEKNLTMLGNSDIHEPDLRRASTAANHRTTTLVFAKDRTVEAIRDALRQRRTVVWWKDRLIGSEQWLAPLLAASVSVAQPHLRDHGAVLVKVRNQSEVDIRLARTGKVGPTEITLPAGSVSLLRIQTRTPKAPLTLEYTAKNFLIGPDRGLPVRWEIPAPSESR